jgi:hypothetical protein
MVHTYYRKLSSDNKTVIHPAIDYSLPVKKIVRRGSYDDIYFEDSGVELTGSIPADRKWRADFYTDMILCCITDEQIEAIKKAKGETK